MKLIALVKSNGTYSLVMDEEPKLTFKKVGGIIYGTDGLFYTCYKYGEMGEGYKAFAGRKFDITLDTGEIIHCEGQWWHDGFNEVSNITGKRIGSVGVGSVDGLKKCYVFTGREIDIDKYNELIKNYDGPIYEYWDYEKVIKFDDMRSGFWKRISKLEKAKKSLIKEVKRRATQIND